MKKLLLPFLFCWINSYGSFVTPMNLEGAKIFFSDSFSFEKVNARPNSFVQVLEVHQDLLNKSGDLRDLYTFGSGSLFTQHPKWGLSHPPSRSVVFGRRFEKEIISKGVYHFDKFGRRFTPQKDLKNKKKFLTLFGGSFTYGDFLSDDETLGYFLGDNLKEYAVFNYAVSSTGPNTMLAQIENRDISNEIDHRKDGLFLYVYINGHNQRVNGFMQELRWLADSPYYEVEGEGVVRNGTFRTARPIYTGLMGFLRDILKINSIFKMNFPKLTKDHYRKTCLVIKSSRDRSKEKFPQSRFVVFNHTLSDPMESSLRHCLKKYSIPVVDIRVREDESDKYRIPFDGHPNRLYNKEFAHKLIQSLKL